jgi:putative acetyltransferase
MTLADYDEVYALWAASEGIGLSSADSREAIGAFLQRNPGLAFVAVDGDIIVGAVICGTDGRRGYLHHLAVRSSHKRQGIGRHLAQACLNRLREQGIEKCHIFVYRENHSARQFWESIGWVERVELVLMTKTLD